MRQVIIAILLFISSTCLAVEKKQPDIDMQKVENFLSRVYFELKCPSYPMQNGYNLEVCLHSLTFDLDDGRILFAFTAYKKNNRLLKNFDDMQRSERQKSLLGLLETMALFTGVLPVNRGVKKEQEVYVGAIQKTPMTHVYNNESIRKNRIIHDFIKDNSVIGIRVLEDRMQYVAFLDLNRDMHYKEGDGVSILGFMTRPTDDKN